MNDWLEPFRAECLMRMIDLFSGIGGFSLAASWVWGEQLEIVLFCENDKFCQRVLNKHWPEVSINEDIKTLDATQLRGTIDLVTGGFPCQPYTGSQQAGLGVFTRFLFRNAVPEYGESSSLKEDKAPIDSA